MRRKIKTNRGSEFVNPNVEKALLKYNTMLHHSPCPIKAALAELLTRTIQLLISRYCILKNTAAFIHDLDKIMQIYNQRLYRSLSNVSPQEVHQGDHNTLVTFLKQYSKEKIVIKNSMLVRERKLLVVH
jgi:hypothetical protein